MGKKTMMNTKNILLIIILFSFLLIPVINTSGSSLTSYFNCDIEQQIVTVKPVLGTSVTYYKIIVENIFDSETSWIPACERTNQIYFLDYNTTYIIRMHYKNATANGTYSKTIRISSAPPPDDPIIEEPIDYIDDTPPRKSIFNGIPEPITNWWNSIGDIGRILVVLPFIIIPLVLINRRKRVKKIIKRKKSS